MAEQEAQTLRSAVLPWVPASVLLRTVLTTLHVLVIAIGLAVCQSHALTAPNVQSAFIHVRGAGWQGEMPEPACPSRPATTSVVAGRHLQSPSAEKTSAPAQQAACQLSSRQVRKTHSAPELASSGKFPSLNLLLPLREVAAGVYPLQPHCSCTSTAMLAPSPPHKMPQHADILPCQKCITDDAADSCKDAFPSTSAFTRHLTVLIREVESAAFAATDIE